MIKTAVMGYGTIGSGVAEILDQKKAGSMRTVRPIMWTAMALM